MRRRLQRTGHRAFLDVAAVALLALVPACRGEAPAAQVPVTVTILTTTVPTTAPPSASAPTAPATTTTVAGVAYVVVAGDTLSGIADRFGIPVAAIISANTLTDPSLLRVGETVIVPAPVGATTTTAPPTAPSPTLGTAEATSTVDEAAGEGVTERPAAEGPAAEEAAAEGEVTADGATVGGRATEEAPTSEDDASVGPGEAGPEAAGTTAGATNVTGGMGETSGAPE